ncbi:TPA: hypothetical protein L6A21_16735 [Pseudomonas aeruginosa]|nr:hypothetical protein AO903_16340 [Pseudomonas aeruginosa]KWR85226.1 hypothetical protein RN02_02900 [Pseudomonas sp. PI1]KSP28981.1 hypothetical protein APB10_05660 [Pseudomonas aeruginosa]ORL54935.1 hypothetical protein B7H20_28610 [Pseudomonas aeruginosa]OVZ39715.1 hypothetical protein CDO41_25865 [Pseudomonas aeruginosa]
MVSNFPSFFWKELLHPISFGWDLEALGWVRAVIRIAITLDLVEHSHTLLCTFHYCIATITLQPSGVGRVIIIGLAIARDLVQKASAIFELNLISTDSGRPEEADISSCT